MKNKFGVILPIILISYFLILLDNSVVFTSTVQIAGSLKMSINSVSWITNIYAITFGSFLLICGKLGDLYGRKIIFIMGLIVFGLCSFLVGISQSGIFIIIIRAFQGIGSAIIAPNSLALILDNYKDKKREKAISYYGITAGLGASIGLIIGGIVTTFVSWRWGFLINVPISIALIMLTIKFIPNTHKDKKIKLDYPGSFLSLIGFLSLVYGVNGYQYKIISLVISIVSLSIFILWEALYNHPLMPLKLFISRNRSSAYISRFFFAGSIISYFFLVPQSLQRIYGFSPLLSAFAFMPETIPQFIFGIVQSKLSEKIRTSTILVYGVILVFIGIVLSSYLGLNHGYLISVAIPMVFIGIGQGLAFGPLTSFGVANATKEIAGVASSVVNVFHQIGSSVILSLVVYMTSNYKLQSTSYHHQMLIISFIMLIPLLMSLNIRMGDK